MLENAAEGLLQDIEALLPALRKNAIRLDEAAAFPGEEFAALSERGLLTASITRARGGAGFGYGEAGALALLQLFTLLGRASLPIARLFEAHVNALQLIERYGSDDLATMAVCAAAEGHIFALWVTDPTAPLMLKPDGAGFVLEGGKAFCSGAGVATRALITAATEAGTRMLVVRLAPDTRVLPSPIKLGGMRAAITGSIDFSGMRVTADALLGEAGDYLKEPVFSAGAWRGSAGAYGGLSRLVELHRAELLHRGRDADLHQKARFGQLLIAHETARLWMREAALAACLEAGTAEATVAYVNLARIAVETACLDALRLTQRSLGLGAFIAGSEVELLCRDLATYLRQPAPDETLDKAAEYYFQHGRS